MKTALQNIKQCLKNDGAIVLARITNTVGTTARKAGAWMVFASCGETAGTVGGGECEKCVAQQVQTVFVDKKSRNYCYCPEGQKDAEKCDGQVTLRLEYFTGDDALNIIDKLSIRQRAVLFGGGHVNYALEPVLRHIGFETVVVDERPDFASRSRFENADAVILVDSFSDISKAVTLTDGDYAIIAAYSHEVDFTILRQVMKSEAKYIGMLSSHRKLATATEILKDDGFTQAQIDVRLHAPIGLSIGAKTPEEISVSIAAEIIAVRAGEGV